jgi:hypothetical protein
MPRILFLFLLVLAAANDPAQAARGARPATTPAAVNDSQWSGTANNRQGPVLLKAQVLLDRAGFSPGAIDGRDGENFAKALRAFQRAHELEPTGKLDRATWDQLVHTSDEPVVRDYTIMAADVMGPFVKTIPRDFQETARLDRLAYHSPRQLLAEKFHLSEQLLAALNKGKNFDRAGTDVVVANVMPLEVPKPSRRGGRRAHVATTGAAGESVKATIRRGVGTRRLSPGGEVVVAIDTRPTITVRPPLAGVSPWVIK